MDFSIMQSTAKVIAQTTDPIKQQTHSPDKTAETPTPESKEKKDPEQKTIPLHFVLDIDNTLAMAKAFNSEAEIHKFLKANNIKEPTISIHMKVPGYTECFGLHILHRGAIEFVRYLHFTLKAKLSVFSSGLAVRNIPFVEKLFILALGKEEYEKIKTNILILSNDKLAYTTIDQDLWQESYGIYSDLPRKDLRVVMNLSKMTTLNGFVLVDDNPNIIYPGQEKHVVRVTGPKKAEDFWNRDGRLGTLLNLNNIFCITGIIKTALEMTTPKKSFHDNLFELQFHLSKYSAQYYLINSDPESDFYNTSQLPFYFSGLEELQKINPSLDLYQRALLDAAIKAESQQRSEEDELDSETEQEESVSISRLALA